jgi:hypothetical protein
MIDRHRLPLPTPRKPLGVGITSRQGGATPLPRDYLALCGRDPDEALLRQLRTVAAGVEPRSRCRVSARAGVTDCVTGAAGVILEVTRLAWIDAAAGEVVGGYYITPWRATALRYRVQCTGERWVVTATSEL